LADRRVLVIDAAYQPICIVGWKRAVTKLFAGRAEVVVYSKDGTVIGRDFRLPAVIQLLDIVPRWKQRVRFCRKNVIVGRDRCICQYCGKRFSTEDLNIDHVVPRAQGGLTCWENVVASCIKCNDRKGPRTPAQASMKLIKRPGKPANLVEISIKTSLHQVPEEWADYWSVPLDK
jgi:5-methylcytosine-specific restriction endonuclease McrA